LVEVKQATEVGKSSWFYNMFTFIITFKLLLFYN
jgi:hypothetical protein